MVKVTKEEYETKSHKFRIPSVEFGGLREDIFVEYRSTLQSSTEEEKGHSELEETLYVDYFLEGCRKSAYFKVFDGNYNEILSTEKEINEEVREILLRELPDHALRILPKK